MTADLAARAARIARRDAAKADRDRWLRQQLDDELAAFEALVNPAPRDPDLAALHRRIAQHRHN